MLSSIEILILAIIQGISEYLPVSSAAHLVLVSKYYVFTNQSLLIDICLHLGSLIAIIFYFRNDILNFIQNSADSISGEGQITLTTEQQGSQLKIKIQDTGHGISEDDIENLFDPFLPLKPNRVRDWVFQSVMVSFGITGEI